MKLYAVFILSFLTVFAAEAKDDYTISVPVETEAEDSVIAKDKAMVEAQREAFYQAAAKLTTEENVQKLKELSDDEIFYFVQSVGVSDEKAGGTKYMANLSVEINEQLLKDYMAENEMINMDTQELLIIPVFKPDAGAKALLWGSDNWWREHWRSKGLIRFGAMQMRSIGEHFRNIHELDAENALLMDTALLEKVTALNRSDKIYIALAEVLKNGDLKITIRNQKNGREDKFAVYNDGVSDVFDKAIEKSVMVVSNIERQSKSVEKTAVGSVINAVYVYSDMKDWLAKSKNLSSLNSVDGIDTKSFGGGKVNFSIRYHGSLDDLWNDMQENGFSHEAAGNYFIIR